METKQATPPGMSADLLATPTAPVIDGGFFNGFAALQLVHEGVSSGVDYSLEAPTDAEEEVARAYAGGLPSREFWIGDPTQNKVEIPTDDYGIVNVEAFIRDVMKTVDPNYSWGGNPDKHHLYWPAQNYQNAQQETGVRTASFRNLGVNIVRIPRILHNWVHAVSTQPNIPDPDAMNGMLDAWISAGSFYEKVQATAESSRLFEREEKRRGGYSLEQENMLRDMLAKDLRGVITHLEELSHTPVEYWPFSPDMKAQIAAGKIGHIILKRCQPRTKFVRYARVA